MTTDTHVPVVQAERNALCDSLLALGPDAPTLCDPWRTRDLAAHLVLREHQPFLATGIWFAPLEGRMERGQAAIAAGDYPALVEKVRSGPPWWSPTHLDKVDALLNTTELVVHHEDALRGDGAVGPRREVPERTARAVLMRTAAVGVADVPPRAGCRCGWSRRAPSRSPPGKGDARRHRDRRARSSCCCSPTAGCAWRPSSSRGRRRTSRPCGTRASASPEAPVAAELRRRHGDGGDAPRGRELPRRA